MLALAKGQERYMTTLATYEVNGDSSPTAPPRACTSVLAPRLAGPFPKATIKTGSISSEIGSTPAQAVDLRAHLV